MFSKKLRIKKYISNTHGLNYNLGANLRTKKLVYHICICICISVNVSCAYKVWHTPSSYGSKLENACDVDTVKSE